MSTALIGTGISSLGSIASGVTSWQAGKEQNKLAKREAGYKALQSAEEVSQMETSLTQLEGTQAARYGASGVRMEGSPADVMLSTERQGRHEINFKKMMDAAQIWEIRKAGKLAQKAGGMGAIGSLLSGIGHFMGSTTGKGIGNSIGNLFSNNNNYKMKNPGSGSYSLLAS